MSSKGENARLKDLTYEQASEIKRLEAEVEFLKPLANALIAQVKAEMAWAQLRATGDETDADIWAAMEDHADELKQQAIVHLEATAWDGALA